MQMQNLRDDECVTSWIAAEAVRYLKNKNKFSAKDNKTKLHKIIYLVADEHDIPITRGWYLHGPFIYNDNILNKNYEDNIEVWTSSKYNIDKIRQDVREYHFNVDEIVSSIEKWSDLINEKSADESILLLYRSYSPEEFRDIYLKKYNLTGVRTNISHLINYYNARLRDKNGSSSLELLQNLYDDVDAFETSAFNTFDDQQLESNTIKFFNVFRELLWKIELLLKEIDLDQKIISSLKYGQDKFVISIWTSYGGNIIKKTAKGINQKNAKQMGNRTRRSTLNSFPDVIFEFNEYCRKYNLNMSYNDMKKYKSQKEDNELDKNLWKLVKISSRLE